MAIRDLTARIRITTDTRGVTKGLKSAGRSVDGFRTDLLAATAAITGGFAAASVAVDQFVEASARAGQKVALQRQLDATGESLDSFLSKLTEVSQGTIATADLITASSNALLLGIPADAIVQLLDQARVAAIATGQDVSKAFSDITLGVARQSRLILDNLGIIIKVEDANDKFAATLGKVASELTDVERRTAFLNETLRIGAARVESFGDAASENALATARFSASITNAVDALFDFANQSDIVATVLDTVAQQMLGSAEAAKANASRTREVNEEYEKIKKTARDVINEHLRLQAELDGTSDEMKEATEAADKYEAALKKLGLTSEQDVIDELEQVRIAMEGANEAARLGGDDLGFYTRQLEELTERERELKVELGLVDPAIEDVTEKTVFAAEATERLGISAGQTALQLDREREAARRLQEQLVGLNTEGVITGNTFDRISQTQGIQAAVNAAVASGATFFGRRIELRGGGRLVPTSVLNNLAGVGIVGNGFGGSQLFRPTSVEEFLGDARR